MAGLLDIPRPSYSLHASSSGSSATAGVGRLADSALQSIHQQPTALSAAFFSADNVNAIQRALRDEVLRRTGKGMAVTQVSSP